MTERPRGARPFAAALVVAAVGFAALGIWQVERRAEKLALVARVDARIHAEPAPFPPRSEWPEIDRDRAEYRRVAADGEFLPVRPAFVQAVTARGAGFWVLSPFRTSGGETVFVNRGFVRPDERSGVAAPAAPGRVAGLLRLPEPGGGFLRTNAPDEDRWYSRDPSALALARGIGSVAPFFVDQDAAASPRRGEPEGGLTVIAFRNEHAVYAATWFALSILSLGGAVTVLRARAAG